MMVFLASVSKTVFDSATQKVLSNPVYKQLENPVDDFFQQLKENLIRFIVKILEKFFGNKFASPKASNEIVAIIMIVGLAATALIIIGIVYFVLKGRQKKQRIKTILGEDITEETTPESLRKKANAYFEEGDLRLAVRFDFIALLLKMHESRLVFLEETWTNEELFNYLVKQNFKSEEPLANLMRKFNAVWYGRKSFEKSDYILWNEHLQVVWKEAESYEV